MEWFFKGKTEVSNWWIHFAVPFSAWGFGDFVVFLLGVYR